MIFDPDPVGSLRMLLTSPVASESNPASLTTAPAALSGATSSATSSATPGVASTATTAATERTTPPQAPGFAPTSPLRTSLSPVSLRPGETARGSVLGTLAQPSHAAVIAEAMPLDAMRTRAGHFARTDEFRSRQAWYEHLGQTGSQPRVLVIGCSDCACDPGLPLGAEPGSLFMLRNAGNIVPPAGNEQGETAAAIELALAEYPIEHLVVCGHSGCRTLETYLDRYAGLAADRSRGEKRHPLSGQWFEYLQKTADAVQRMQPDADIDQAAWSAQHNVLVQTHHLSTHPAVAARLGLGDLHLHAWYFDTAAGELFEARSLKFTDDVCGQFEAL